MSEEAKNSSNETNESEDKQEKPSISGISIAIETTDDKKEPERPGVCCGECS